MPLLNDQCAATIGPWDDEDAIRLGMIGPLSGLNSESGLYATLAMELALNEINNLGGVGGHQNRPLAVLACDDQGEPDLGVEAARHLVDRVGVPAIIPSYSKVTLEVAEEVAIPEEVLLLAYSSTAASIADLEDQDLVWRLAPPDGFQGDTLAFFGMWQLIEHTHAGDDGIRGDNGLDDSNARGAPRVGLVYVDDVYGRGIRDELRSRLEAYLSLSTGGVPIFIDLPYEPRESSNLQSTIQELKSNPPPVVVIAGYEESVNLLAEIIDHKVLSKSAFLLTDGVQSDQLRTLYESNEELPALLFGTSPGARSGELFDEFEASFTQAWGADNAPIWSEYAYDSTYVLALALGAVDGAITGPSIAESMMLFTDPEGRSFEIGRDQFIAAGSAMATGESVSMLGTSGPIQLDASTGEPSAADIRRWAVDPASDEFTECGIVSTYSPTASTQRDWCAARCMEGKSEDCIPESMLFLYEE
jgi:ABC-type branched-subunit amino acid transport system substrate-binding protein